MSHNVSPSPKPNRLAKEKSPYLLQHALNPVDWYPWGEEAFEKARKENKPIFLSIGYSSCHWCHVMEGESFEDPAIAKLLNDSFVSIKVDREERPDVDEIYMKAVMAMTGSGGWPLSVFLTPRLEPFFGGTYFPPAPRQGMPGFANLLTRIANTWKHDRKNLADSGSKMKQAIAEMYATDRSSADKLSTSPLEDCFGSLSMSFDRMYGGFGLSPKFPTPSYHLFLMRFYKTSELKGALQMVEKTLEMMARGGIYDHVGGGFHRYSTDRFWLVPHFEKMLYDNALLVSTYCEAYLLTRNQLYRDVVFETLDWVKREMTSPEGGFFSAVDADSPDGEGSYYVWNKEDLSNALGGKNEEIVSSYFSITPEGNFEDGRSILTSQKDYTSIGSQFDKSANEIEEIVTKAKKAMLEFRMKNRKRPAVDDKVLLGWNGLMISAFSKAYQVFGDEKHLEMAKRSADFAISNLQSDGTLKRFWREGEARGQGTLEDYSFFSNSLVDLYESCFDSTYLERARDISLGMISRLYDEKSGGFFQSEKRPDLIARPKDAYDGAIPSGNSIAAVVLIRLSELLGKEDLSQKAKATLEAFWPQISAQPQSFTHMLIALDLLLGKRKEIVISGSLKSASTRKLIEALRSEYLPRSVIAFADEKMSTLSPLVEGRITLGDAKPKVFVCSNFTCKLPSETPEDLRQALNEQENS